MTITRIAIAAAALAIVTGCSGGTPPFAHKSATMPHYTPAWREIATAADRERLRDWRSIFVAALADARKAGHGADIDREGPLLDPDAALADSRIPDGRYRCRVTKIGAKTEGMLHYIAYPAFDCGVGMDGALQRLEKVSGSQRQVGILYAHDAMRQVFLGTLVLGDENRAMQYGQDSSRDVAGYLERIGDRRWRLVMPRPEYESQTDVLELVPAG